ncbi:MAG: type II toxin-antitoxin system VapB family antitoxin [Myxococcales bacterium]|nr:type II toxin-antitoxin system VapB family antitoxin [Myxococcales bacterium]
MKTSIEIDDQLYRRARLVAVENGTTLRALVEAGLRAVLPATLEENVETRLTKSLAAMRELQAEFAAAATGDRRTDDEILGYDERGLPS